MVSLMGLAIAPRVRKGLRNDGATKTYREPTLQLEPKEGTKLWSTRIFPSCGVGGIDESLNRRFSSFLDPPEYDK